MFDRASEQQLTTAINHTKVGKKLKIEDLQAEL